MQFRTLLSRAWRNYVRDRRHSVDNIAQTVVVALLVGLVRHRPLRTLFTRKQVFLRLGHDQPAIQNRAGVIYFLAVFTAFSSLNSALFLFPAERAVFMREVCIFRSSPRSASLQYAKDLYGVGPYFLAKTISELPLQSTTPH